MNRPDSLPLCPACRQGRLHAIEHDQVFRPHGREVRVVLLASRCDTCGVQTTRAAQHDENLRRLATRKAHYGSLLMGEEILALRKRYGLTQQQASKVFGKGKIAFSRYETEASYPDETTTLLLQVAIERPEVMKDLADKAGVELPLWQQRSDDDRRHKLVLWNAPTAREPKRASLRQIYIGNPMRTPELPADERFALAA